MTAEPKSIAIRHYLVLLFLMVMGIWGIALVSFDKSIQLVIIWSMAAGYLAWGLIHHWIHDDLHLKVALEYLLITAIGILTVSALLLQR
jgi:hypothetical protein